MRCIRRATPTSYSSPQGGGGRLALRLFLDSLQPAHVAAQHLRYCDGTVGVLVIFENRDERAADGQTRAVERVDEARALAFGRAEARVHTPRLELAADRAGRNLAIAPLPW